MCPRIITTLPGSVMAVVASDIIPILQVEGRRKHTKPMTGIVFHLEMKVFFLETSPITSTRAYTDRGMCCHAPATLCSLTKGSRQHFTEITSILLKPHTESC